MAEPRTRAGRVPPNNFEAEQSVLGSMLLSASCVDDALEGLLSSDFYTPRHREIFEAMSRLAESGSAVDMITVSERLERDGKLDIGGLEYLSTLTEAVPSIANIGYHIKILQEKSTLRKLIGLASDIADDCFRSELSAEDIVSRAGDGIYKIATRDEKRDLVHIKQALSEAYAKISEAYASKDGLMGLTTGFPRMDSTLSGLQGTQLIVIAGRPGMGKTSFALNIVQHLTMQKQKPCLVFSLEMSADQLATRLLCSESQVDQQKVRSGRLGQGDIDSLGSGLKKLSNAPIYIGDNPMISVTEMRAKAHRMLRGPGLSLIAIDYLQLMQATGRVENRQQEVSQLTRHIKILAKELNVPILLLSQLSRASEKRDKKSRWPLLSDLRESGAIEQDADVVMFIQREDYYEEDRTPENKGRARIIIAKQRNGPTATIEVKWRGELTKFEEIDFVHDDEPEY